MPFSEVPERPAISGLCVEKSRATSTQQNVQGLMQWGWQQDGALLAVSWLQ